MIQCSKYCLSTHIGWIWQVNTSTINGSTLKVLVQLFWTTWNKEPWLSHTRAQCHEWRVMQLVLSVQWKFWNQYTYWVKQFLYAEITWQSKKNNASVSDLDQSSSILYISIYLTLVMSTILKNLDTVETGHVWTSNTQKLGKAGEWSYAFVSLMKLLE